MSSKFQSYRLTVITLLFCFLQIAGIDVSYSQTPIEDVVQDSITVREAPKARARRNRIDQLAENDSLLQTTPILLQDSIVPLPIDSLEKMALETQNAIDSIEEANRKALEELESTFAVEQPQDSVVFTPPALTQQPPRKIWTPNPTKATWYAVVFPGGGQIYNRKFWKLPIIYGGFAGCAYALSWNGQMYSDYSQAYLDIMDDDPNTNSFLDLLPNRLSNYSEAQLKELIRKRKDMFRRYRDLSIFAIIGVYLISIVDAYVDAELSNFDIGPDLSLRLEPTIINNTHGYNTRSVGVQCSFRF